MKKNDLGELKNINSIAWHIKENEHGDCLFAPSYSAVRFYDTEGNYWEIPITSVLWSEKKQEYNDYIAGKILNSIFHTTIGILLDKWIGVNCTLSESVNQARKELPLKIKKEAEHWFRKEYTI